MSRRITIKEQKEILEMIVNNMEEIEIGGNPLVLGFDSRHMRIDFNPILEEDLRDANGDPITFEQFTIDFVNTGFGPIADKLYNGEITQFYPNKYSTAGNSVSIQIVEI